MIDVIGKCLLLVLGAFIGFMFACIGTTRIITEKKDLKDELAQVKAERDYLAELAKSNTQTIEIRDNRPEATGDYFKPF